MVRLHISEFNPKRKHSMKMIQEVWQPGKLCCLCALIAKLGIWIQTSTPPWRRVDQFPKSKGCSANVA
eukprot:7359854-Heterocapsa_arctica.AAC.1